MRYRTTLKLKQGTGVLNRSVCLTAKDVEIVRELASRYFKGYMSNMIRDAIREQGIKHGLMTRAEKRRVNGWS